MTFAFRRRALAAGSLISIALAVVLLTLVLATDVFAGKPRVAYRWNHAPTGGQQSAAAEAFNAKEIAVNGTAWKTIELHELFGDKFTPIDVGKRGDSVGDYGVFRDKVADAATDEVLGTIDVICFSGYADLCNATIRIKGQGQINANGMTPLGVDPDRFPITGGTGDFADVGGVLTVEFPSDQYALLTLTLTR